MERSPGHENGIVIPFQRLAPDALRGLIEEFVSRDGTDTGDTKTALADRVGQVLGQLKKGASLIVFDEKSGTANIVPREDVRK